ncbi:Zinc fingerC2H2 type family protein [Aphelenchoides avenae]|nr:Zinc fingerC2H2 type family protein [Aphelenchus avenae]
MVHTSDEQNGQCSVDSTSSEAQPPPGQHRNGMSGDVHAAKTNGSTVANGSAVVQKHSPGTSDAKPPPPVVIEIDDDDDDSVKEPVAKRRRESPVPEDPKVSKPSTPSSTSAATPPTRKPSTGKKEAELTSYSALLDKLESYTTNAIASKENVDRKVLDALLAAINIQVQKEPYSVRKLILEKQLVLPNTISFPPSQLSRVITKLFGDERPKLSDSERRERQQLKISHPAPNMTKLLMDIGLDLVQESTYCDIVHARNLPEIPKNMDTYKQVAAQLKPVWEALKAKNEPLKLKVLTCQVCGYRTDSRTVMAIHRQTLHFSGRKYQCAMCPEFDTNESRINRHYMKEHGLKPTEREEPPGKVQCPICEEDFAYKGHRDAHLKMCKRDVNRIKTLQATRAPEHIGMINRWLWDKPPIEPSILAQQQDLQKQQQLKQQQQRLAAAAAAAANVAHVQAAPAKHAISANSIAQRGVGPSNGAGVRGISAQQALAQQREQQLKLQLLQNNRQQLAALLKNPNNMNPAILQAIQQMQRQQQLLQQQINAAKVVGTSPVAPSPPKSTASSTPRGRQGLPAQHQTPTSTRAVPSAAAITATGGAVICEICDVPITDRSVYLGHLQTNHKQLRGKTIADMQQGAPLACSRCRDRFWTYEGLERHLVMGHGLVTSDLLAKAQRKDDGGRCKLCGKQYAFNMLQHLVTDHQVKLCSAEIMYSCDVCAFKCSSYQKLEAHLSEVHPKSQTGTPGPTVR